MTDAPAPYQYVDPDAFLQRHQEALAERTSGPSGWKPKVGPPTKPVRNVIRVLPPHVNMGKAPIIKMKVHFSLGPKMDTASPCLESFGQPCPACNWVDTLYARARAGAHDPGWSQQMKDMAGKQRAKLRHAINLVDVIDQNTLAKGVQTWFFGQDVYDFLWACFFDDNNPPQFRDITHPQTGRDLILEVEKKLNTDFNDYKVFRPKDTPTPLHDPQWLYQLVDLTDYVYQPTTDEVNGALQGKKIERTSRTARLSAGSPPPAQAALPPAQPPAAVPTPPPAPPAAPTPPPAALAPVPGPTLAPPVATSVPAPPAAPAPPAGAPRGRRGAGAGPAPTPAPTPPVAPTPAPPVSSAPAPTPPAQPSRRQPMTVAGAPTNGGDPYPQARGELDRLKQIGVVKPLGDGSHFVPHEPTQAELDSPRKPPCFLLETLPEDAGCQTCAVLLPCLQARIAGAPGAAPWVYPQAS